MGTFSVENLVAYWSRLGGNLRSGASEEELVAFEDRYQVQLPNDLRVTLAAVNGCEEWDDNMITFLSLGEILPIKEYWKGYWPDEPEYFAFAEHLLDSFAFAIRLLPQRGAENSVAVFYERTPIKVASSFSEFIGGYLTDNRAILYPDPIR